MAARRKFTFGGVTPKQTIALASENDETLTSIDLSGNASFQNNPNENCRGLAEALKQNTHITSINLSSCEITDADVSLLAEALAVNTSVITLNLEKNKIKNEGSAALARGLAQNSVLTTINLLNQPGDFGEVCLDEWLTMFETNSTISNIIWALHSKKSFALTQCITRNKRKSSSAGLNLKTAATLSTMARKFSAPAPAPAHATPATPATSAFSASASWLLLLLLLPLLPHPVPPPSPHLSSFRPSSPQCKVLIEW
jgi:hypothetical protein